MFALRAEEKQKAKSKSMEANIIVEIMVHKTSEICYYVTNRNGFGLLWGPAKRRIDDMHCSFCTSSALDASPSARCSLKRTKLKADRDKIPSPLLLCVERCYYYYLCENIIYKHSPNTFSFAISPGESGKERGRASSSISPD